MLNEFNLKSFKFISLFSITNKTICRNLKIIQDYAGRVNNNKKKIGTYLKLPVRDSRGVVGRRAQSSRTVTKSHSFKQKKKKQVLGKVYQLPMMSRAGPREKHVTV